MSSTRKRRYFKAEDKVAMVRRQLIDKVPVSDLCEEHDIKPTQYYTWQKQFFERGEAAFHSSSDSEQKQLERENAKLKDKLQKKDEIIAEVAEAFVTLKKELGES